MVFHSSTNPMVLHSSMLGCHDGEGLHMLFPARPLLWVVDYGEDSSMGKGRPFGMQSQMFQHLNRRENPVYPSVTFILTTPSLKALSFWQGGF